MKIRLDPFLLGMVAAVGLAWAFPGVGASDGPLHPEIVTKVGVGLLFFFHGLALPFEALRAGTLNWRLHLLVQSTTFLFFPVLWLLLDLGARHVFPADLRLGFFFLSALPSTVSSSVAMTAAARGNVAGAVFNATLSSLIGVFATPLWVAFAIEGGAAGGEGFSLGPVVVEIVLLLLVPFGIGQLLHRWWGTWAMAHKPVLHRFDRLIILLLIYTAFCESMAQGIWSGHGPGLLVSVLVGAVVIFVVVMGAVALACRALRFNREDTIAALFCGSKKTLVSGVPMANLLFGASPALGMLLLPILLYHQLQLIVCSMLADRFARSVPDAAPRSPAR